ncbi:MAG: hypothetical protein CSB01_04350 [Bacteroidia bacterium]|nr:MAG: hypothetical protein CSB01_04350 [Bacteroidia bacterium]
MRDDKVNEDYTIAACCQPIPGDEVVGFLDFKGNVQIHKRKCQRIVNISTRQGDRLLTAYWKTHKVRSFLASIVMEGVDRHGLLNEITNVISNDHNVSMRALSVKASDGVFTGDIELYVPHIQELKKVLKQLGLIKGITSVQRKENAQNVP